MVPQRLLVATGASAAVLLALRWARSGRAGAPVRRRLHVHTYRAPACGVAALGLDPSIEFTAGPVAPPTSNVLLLFEGAAEEKGLAAELAELSALEAVIIPFAGPLPAVRQGLQAEVGRRAKAGAPPLHIFNSHHNAPATAEMAVSLLLTCAKRLLPADAALRRGDWSHRGLPLPGGPTPPPPPLHALVLQGRRAVIVGLGEVGQRVALSCAALGMEVHATSRSCKAPRELVVAVGPISARVCLHPAATLRQLFAHPSTAAVVLCAPDTPETAGMVGEEELAALPPDAVLVNVGRGSLVQPAPLRRALERGALGGYASDVWWNYPKSFAEVARTPAWADEAHSLQALDHLTVLSPHRGGGIGNEAVERARWSGMAAALNAALRVGVGKGLNQFPLGVFRLERGY